MPPNGARRLEEYVGKGLLGLVGASLSINSYLVKEKVGEISENLKAMALAIRTLELNGAVTQQQMTAVEAHNHQNSLRIDRANERLETLEEAVAKLSERLRMEFRKP